MRTEQMIFGVGVLAAVMLSGVGYGFEPTGSRSETEVLEPFVLASQKSEPMGCNNFATLISGAVAEDDALTAPWSPSSVRINTALSGISVSIYRQSGQSWIKEATTYTGTDGQYEFCEVPNGTYRVRFCHPDFVQEFWNNKPSFGTSNTLVISNVVKQVTGISALLVPGDGPGDCP